MCKHALADETCFIDHKIMARRVACPPTPVSHNWNYYHQILEQKDNTGYIAGILMTDDHFIETIRSKHSLELELG
jgi:hypothetical protein